MTRDKFMTCNNRGITQATLIAVFAWSPTLRPAMVQRLMSKGYEAPTHIYVNSGLHILHADPTWPWTIENGYERWRNYETDLHGTFHAYMQNAPKAQLVFMSTHSVCEAKYTDGGVYKYRSVVDAYRRNPAEGAASCITRLSSRFDKSNAMTDCIDGLRIGRGAQLLNARLHKVLQLDNYTSVLEVDAHAITHDRCEATPDGVHYNILILEELWELFAKLGWGHHHHHHHHHRHYHQ